MDWQMITKYTILNGIMSLSRRSKSMIKVLRQYLVQQMLSIDAQIHIPTNKSPTIYGCSLV